MGHRGRGIEGSRAQCSSQSPLRTASSCRRLSTAIDPALYMCTTSDKWAIQCMRGKQLLDDRRRVVAGLSRVQQEEAIFPLLSGEPGARGKRRTHIWSVEIRIIRRRGSHPTHLTQTVGFCGDRRGSEGVLLGPSPEARRVLQCFSVLRRTLGLRLARAGCRAYKLL